MNGKTDKRRKYSKEADDAYKSNKFWRSNDETTKEDKKSSKQN